MGSHSVSETQLPGSSDGGAGGEQEVSALVKVSGDECLRQENGVRFNYLSIVRPGDDEDVKEADGQSGLRKRGGAKGETSATSGVSEVKEDDGKKKPTDPLRWFGVLVPQSLRQAQSRFTRATEQAVECANVQSEIAGVLARQKFLLRMKAKAEAKSADGTD